MIVLSNLTAQTLQPGQAVTFDRVIYWGGNCECFNRQLPQSVRLNDTGGVWSLGFSGNITSATAGDVLQIAIAVSGQPLIETAMNHTVTTANALENVSTETRFSPGCDDANRVSVINTGTTAVTLAPNSAFVIDRRG